MSAAAAGRRQDAVHARKLLAASTLPVEEIALKSGFASVQAFRACWNKGEAGTPSAYRQASTRSAG
ncbi:MAG: helix-turn-helix domain-containing protein [Cupriavidus necator]